MTAATAPPAFVHAAFRYADEEAYLAGIVPFVEEGIAAGHPVLVAVPAERLALLRRQFAARPPVLHFSPMEEMGRNPAWIIPAWADFLAAHRASGTPVRGIGEPIWHGRSNDELVECERHEALLNVAFAQEPDFQLLCPYDSSTLDAAVIEQAAANHPHVCRLGEGTTASTGFDAAVPDSLDAALPPVPADAILIRFEGVPDLRALRLRTAEAAMAAGVDRARVDDVVVAVCEAVTNSVQHAGGTTTVAQWGDGRSFVCEVRDRACISDPLAGRVRPPVTQTGGRGLWVMHQLCDLVQLRKLPDGQAVRLHVRC